MRDLSQERKRRRDDMYEAEFEKLNKSIDATCERIGDMNEKINAMDEKLTEKFTALMDKLTKLEHMMSDFINQWRLKQSLQTTQTPIEDSTQISPIEDSTQISPIEVSAQSPPAIDHNIQISPVIENTQNPPAIDHDTSSPTIDTQIEHPRVIHPPRGSSNGRACLPQSPPNFNGRPRILGKGIKTLPLLIEEFNLIDSCKWAKSAKERQYLMRRRPTVEYLRLSKSEPLANEFGQVDLLELYRDKQGLTMTQLSTKIKSFSEETETVGGRKRRNFNLTSKEKVDDLLRDFITISSRYGLELSLRESKRSRIENLE